MRSAVDPASDCWCGLPAGHRPPSPHDMQNCLTVNERRPAQGYDRAGRDAVEPVDEQPPAEIDVPRSRSERARVRAAAVKARGRLLAKRAEAERSRHASVDAVFEMVDRDLEVGGGIIAGALAYRLFIWLLPAALVAVAGLGIAADAAEESPKRAAESMGLSGLVTNSVASAANSSARWYALVIGIPLLVIATRSV